MPKATAVLCPVSSWESGQIKVRRLRCLGGGSGIVNEEQVVESEGPRFVVGVFQGFHDLQWQPAAQGVRVDDGWVTAGGMYYLVGPHRPIPRARRRCF